MMSHRICIKLFVLFSIFVVYGMFLSACASSEEKKENWGVELPLPQGTTGSVNIFSIYYNQKNEVIIPYYFSNKGKEFVRYYNFSTNILEHECQGNDQEIDECIKRSVLNFKRIVGKSDLKLNGVLHFKSISDGNCSNPLSNGVVIHDSHGALVEKKIIKLYKNKEIFNISTDCSLSDGRDVHYINSESLFFEFYLLKDSTVLGCASNKPILIRFKEDMTSPYLKNNQNYILMDGKKVDDIYHQCLHEIYKIKTSLSDIEAADICFIKFITE